jgi:hypothetical protein
MRRSLTVCRSGLSVAAAVVLLTACGGSDEESSAASESSAATSSAAETTAEGPDSEFCTEAAQVQERITSSVGELGAGGNFADSLAAAADEVQSIEAPDEIAADWNALADGLDQFAAAIEGIDPEDPNALGSLEQQFGEIEARLGTASANVQNYLVNECGIQIQPSEPAAPTS